MPYIDLKRVDREIALDFVRTVRGNMEGFTSREIEEARAARKAQRMMSHPTGCNPLRMVHANMITNCPITVSVAQNANQIFGPDHAGVRGRTAH